jgi:hypothetical protein
VKKSNIIGGGQGLYTTKDIKKNSTIAGYGGEVVSRQTYNQRPSGYGIALNKKQILDGRSTQSGLGRYSNNCRKGNKKKKQCRGNNSRITVNQRKRTARLKATKNIKKGSEIFTSYGRSFF